MQEQSLSVNSVVWVYTTNPSSFYIGQAILSDAYGCHSQAATQSQVPVLASTWK